MIEKIIFDEKILDQKLQKVDIGNFFRRKFFPGALSFFGKSK